MSGGDRRDSLAGGQTFLNLSGDRQARGEGANDRGQIEINVTQLRM